MKGRITKKITLIIIALTIICSFSIFSVLLNNIFTFDSGSSEVENGNELIEETREYPHSSGNKPNSRPLLITQHATVSTSTFPFNLPKNVSFTLNEGWKSNNITINYEGVSYKKNRVSNGEFSTDGSGWHFRRGTTEFSNGGWKGGGYMEIGMLSGAKAAGDFGFFEQNISLQEDLTPNKIATASFDYYYNDNQVPNDISAYLAISIDGVEVNRTIAFTDLVQAQWTTITLNFDAVDEGQVLPGNVSVRTGIVVDTATSVSGGNQVFWVDNVVFNLWTKPNQANLVKAYDVEFDKYYSYSNTTNGMGTSFIARERQRSFNDEVIFTISQNVTGVDDFEIFNITINSYLTKNYNTTISGTTGSLYETGTTINWSAQCFFNQPFTYLNNWIEIEKPSDWNVIHIYDGFLIDQIASCTGIGIGSQRFVIPEGVYTAGLWEFEAVSQNYIEEGQLGRWNGSEFVSSTKLTMNDIFHLNVTLNDTISLLNTQINCTINYPNATVLWRGSKAPSDFIVSFGNFKVGKNMTIGLYDVFMEWTNNLSSSSRDQVGYVYYQFEVWHRTNLTAVEDYFEITAGEALLIKVNYTDYDFKAFISLATVSYNISNGMSGSMAYIGSGIYALDMETSGLSLGDYYFSFNASKRFYENQTISNLIHLKIVAESMILEVPKKAIEASANSYAVCQINVTGAISKSFIHPVNLTTDWDNIYTVIDHLNGTYTLNLSTNGLPASGIVETFTITVSVNKTYFGEAIGYLSLIIYPIQTEISANVTFIDAYINEVIDIEVNYTIKGTGSLIADGNCTTTWVGAHDIITTTYGFKITLYTYGLTLETHSALIKIEKPGYQTAYKGLSINIGNQLTNLTVIINDQDIQENQLLDLEFKQIINVSVCCYALGEKSFISNGNVTWKSDRFDFSILPNGIWYNISIEIDGAKYDPGLNSITILFEKENYTTKMFQFQLFITEQTVNVTVLIDSQQIQENTLLNVEFRQAIDISIRAFVSSEGIFATGAVITWISDYYQENITETNFAWYNTSIDIDAAHFSPGVNYVTLKFDHVNYTSQIFSFQMFITEQAVNLTVLINSAQIQENTLIEVEFKQSINISMKVFAITEGIYISGATILWISDYYQKNITETMDAWYNTSIIIDGAYFSTGVNYVVLRFEKSNYTTKLFAFQLFISAQSVNLTLSIDSNHISEGTLINATYYDEILLSARAFANSERIYLTGGSILFESDEHSFELIETTDFWFNGTLVILPSYFTIPSSYIVNIRFEQANYTETIFVFQLLIKRIIMNVSTIEVGESIDLHPGDVQTVRISVIDSKSGTYVQNATISYFWQYGTGEFTYLGEGIYEFILEIPMFTKGTYIVSIFIDPRESTYIPTETSLVVTITEIPPPDYLTWIIVLSLVGGLSVLGAFSIRSYVILPRKRKQALDLQKKIQVFKDVDNIRAIILMHKKSGIPIYNKNISIFQNEDEFLISGFIQAIANFSEEVVKRESEELKVIDKEAKYLEHIIELDFKYFHLLVCDFKALRVLLVLKGRSSDRLKKQLYLFTIGVYSQFSEELIEFTGRVQKIDAQLEYFMNQFLYLHYNEDFNLTSDQKRLTDVKNSGDITKLGFELLSVIEKTARKNHDFLLSDIVKQFKEEKVDHIYEALLSLISMKIIVPAYFKELALKE